MDTQRSPPRTLGQKLVGQRDRELISTAEACLMFINHVELDAIPGELKRYHGDSERS